MAGAAKYQQINGGGFHRRCSFRVGGLRRAATSHARPTPAAASTDDPGGHESSSQSRLGRSISNLDSLLSSLDEDDGPRGTSRASGRSSRLLSSRALHNAGFLELGETSIEAPKVLPTLTFILYYDHIVLHSVAIWLDVTEGAGAGSDFTNGFVNDHLTLLQGGDVLRLLTSPLVHPSSWALLVALLAIGVLASELEGLIGYWSFGCLYVLVSLFTGVVEAVADQVPITQGSLPVIAGFVGALLVTYGKTALLEEQVAEAVASPTVRATRPREEMPPGGPGSSARAGAGGSDDGSAAGATDMAARSELSPAGDPPSSSDSNPAQVGSRRRWQHAVSVGSGEREAPSSPLPEQSSQGARVRPRVGEAHDKEAEVEFLEGLLKLKFPTNGRVQAIVALSTAACGCLEALWDLRQEAGVTTSWLGVTAGLVAGAFLAWGLAPSYVVERVDRASAIAAVRAQQYAIKHWAYDLVALLGRGKGGAPGPRQVQATHAQGGPDGGHLGEVSMAGEEAAAAAARETEGILAALGGGGSQGGSSSSSAPPSSGTDMLRLRDVVPVWQRVGVVAAMTAAIVVIRALAVPLAGLT